ncbi:MAG: ankyrin repeat domain-containing protein [Rickettsiaceae bacterium]|nr:ankyrin repeat domain-containing protein [Rickettsiaceae bacterium]
MDLFSMAIRGCHDEDIKELTKTWVNINSTNAYGMTPLEIACAFGNVQVVEELIKLGAKVDESYKSITLNSEVHRLLNIGIAVDKALNNQEYSKSDAKIIQKKANKDIVLSRMKSMFEELSDIDKENIQSIYDTPLDASIIGAIEESIPLDD